MEENQIMEMEPKYFSIVTDIGTSLMTKALSEGVMLDITEIAVGDGGGGYYRPDASQTQLVNEVWRGKINSYKISEESENIIIIGAIIPSDIGGFIIREIGVFGDNNVMIGIGNTPDTPKITVTDGVVNEMKLEMELAFINGQSANFNIDPTTLTATKEDVNKVLKKVEEVNIPEFVEAENRENIESGETLSILFGKIKKWFSDLKAAAFAGLANNCTTTVEGYALDARQGKALQDKVNQINSNISSINTEVTATKKSVADGKTAVAAAISAKGVSTAADATFATMAANIKNIVTTKQPAIKYRSVFFNEISVTVNITLNKHYLFVYSASSPTSNSGWSNSAYTLNGMSYVELYRGQEQNSKGYYIGSVILYATATSNSLYFYKRFSELSDDASKGSGTLIVFQLD